MGEFWYFGGYQGPVNTLRQASKIEGQGFMDRLVIGPVLVDETLSKAVNWYEKLICHLISILEHAIHLCILNQMFYFASTITMIKHAISKFGLIIDRNREPRTTVRLGSTVWSASFDI